MVTNCDCIVTGLELPLLGICCGGLAFYTMRCKYLQDLDLDYTWHKLQGGNVLLLKNTVLCNVLPGFLWGLLLFLNAVHASCLMTEFHMLCFLQARPFGARQLARPPKRPSGHVPGGPFGILHSFLFCSHVRACTQTRLDVNGQLQAGLQRRRAQLLRLSLWLVQWHLRRNSGS